MRSQNGLADARHLLLQIFSDLSKMSAIGRFNLVAFGSDFHRLFPTEMAVTAETCTAAAEYVKSELKEDMATLGGTEVTREREKRV